MVILHKIVRPFCLLAAVIVEEYSDARARVWSEPWQRQLRKWRRR